MSRDEQIPASLPGIALELAEDRSPEASGFLRLVRRQLIARYADGTRSEPFEYDEVDRRALDAVVIAAHYERGGEHYVYLRSALRPPVSLRDPARSPLDVGDPLPGLWELPAGLIEPGEHGESGVREAARRELHEELGFDVAPERLQPLGHSCFPAPGVIAERQFFYRVEVDPEQRGEPVLDGSPLEARALIFAAPVQRCLELARHGQLPDSKTELALRRLSEELA